MCGNDCLHAHTLLNSMAMRGKHIYILDLIIYTDFSFFLLMQADRYDKEAVRF